MKVIGLAFACILNVLIHASTYIIDMAHSNVDFQVRYMMLSNVNGTFQSFEGSVTLKDDVINSIVGKVDVNSVNTSNKKRDNHLKSADFFHVEKYPYIHFRSNQIKMVESGYVVIGELEMHGIKQDISIPVQVTDIIKDVYGKNRFAISGSLRLNRKEYGILFSKKMDNGGLVVGEFVDIGLDIQVVEDKSSG